MSNPKTKPIKIEVFDAPFSLTVIASFTNKAKASTYFKQYPGLYADQVAINDQVILGWDEYDQYIAMAEHGII